MKRFFVCFVAFLEKNNDEKMPTILETMTEEQRNDCFLPEMNAVLSNPLVANSYREIQELFSLGFEKEEVVCIIDTESCYVHVYNGMDIEVVKNKYLPRFIDIYNKTSERLSIPNISQYIVGVEKMSL